MTRWSLLSTKRPLLEHHVRGHYSSRTGARCRCGGWPRPRRRPVTTYLLDANVFMSASRLHYGLDFSPASWSRLQPHTASFAGASQGAVVEASTCIAGSESVRVQSAASPLPRGPMSTASERVSGVGLRTPGSCGLQDGTLPLALRTSGRRFCPGGIAGLRWLRRLPASRPRIALPCCDVSSSLCVDYDARETLAGHSELSGVDCKDRCLRIESSPDSSQSTSIPWCRASIPRGLALTPCVHAGGLRGQQARSLARILMDSLP